MDSGVRGKRVFAVIFLFLIVLIFPPRANAVVFNQQDIDRLAEVASAIQSLAQDITRSLKNFTPYEVGKTKMYAIIEADLEATRERWDSVLLLVIVVSQMETWSDEAKILNLLYEEVLPKAKVYVTAKKNAIVRIGGASDNQLALYSGRAASILENQALPLLDRLYQRIMSIRK
jgi:hypothetical protein